MYRMIQILNTFRSPKIGSTKCETVAKIQDKQVAKLLSNDHVCHRTGSRKTVAHCDR